MSSLLHVRIVPKDGIHDRERTESVGEEPAIARMAGGLRRAIGRTRAWLSAAQHADGYWVGELEGDTILESEYILLLAYLGEEQSDGARRAARWLLETQRPDGGWGMYPGGALEISGSVKAYFALKLVGEDPSSEPMRRARQAILAHGGADAVNSFTRFYLALLGQIGYEHCPAVPPELVLLPKWFPVNLYAMSAWTRTIVVPLSIMAAQRPVQAIDPRRGIRELFLREPAEWPALRGPGVKGGTGFWSWDHLFRRVNGLIHWCQRHRVLPLRTWALAAAEDWMLRRFAHSDGLGAIFPPMVWSVIALKCLGYRDDSTEMRYCRERLEGLVIDEGEARRIQPCKSPVWDTALVLRALAVAGKRADDAGCRRGIEWLLNEQISRTGDWAETVQAEPGGWCFEHANAFYPDVDDTAMVLLALGEQWHDEPMGGELLPAELRLVADDRVGEPGEARERVVLLDRTARAMERGERWMWAMQNRDGGFGAFDRDNDSEFLCYIPFADHNAMIDPSTPDLTGRVLEAAGAMGRRVGDARVDRAVAYLRETQEADGSWYGRWGVNYVYGTWQVLTGLAAVGVPADDPAMAAGANWLLAHQQEHGGWGESCESYARRELRGQGTATASQTAWGVLGLLAAGLAEHPAVARGVDYLVRAQRGDGTWEEKEFTGTGFPCVFYLRYHYYPIYFPLMALARWSQAMEGRGGTSAAVSLRVVSAE